MKLNLHAAIVSLATALDFVGVDEIHHGKRVALMAEMLASSLGWDDPSRLHLLYAGMLHDCGVSATREHKKLVDEMDWEGAEAHCLRGSAYLSACPPLAHLAQTVRYHHTHWGMFDDIDLAPEVRERANLIFLADRVDVLYAAATGGGTAHHHVLVERERIAAEICNHRQLFAPHLLDCFCELSRRESFWLALDPGFIDLHLQQHPLRADDGEMELPELRAIARLFAHVVDAKSPFTAEHSARVAALARHLALRAGCTPEVAAMLEIAGLLHDLGKLRVADELLEKPGPLDHDERSLITSHSYDTYQILSAAFPGTPLPSWAGLHHENLLGTGYPFRVDARQLTIEHRIITVADIFQALVQERPYRRPLTAPEALDHLRVLAAEGKVDDAVVGLVAGDLEECYRIAAGEGSG